MASLLFAPGNDRIFCPAFLEYLVPFSKRFFIIGLFLHSKPFKIFKLFKIILLRRDFLMKRFDYIEPFCMGGKRMTLFKKLTNFNISK